jgi:hypothetical protein
MGMPEKDMFGKPWPSVHQNALQSTLGGTTGGGSANAAAGAKYDQWSGKGNVTKSGNFGNVEGFDQKNWDDPNMQTAKYQAGRIFSRFDPNDGNVLAAILNDPEFKQMFGGAKGVGPDKIDFGDGRPVDVIRGHGAPGAKFSWQTEDGPGIPGLVSGSGATGASQIPIAGQQSDLMAQIMAALQQDQQPDPQVLLQEQLR